MAQASDTSPSVPTRTGPAVDGLNTKFDALSGSIGGTPLYGGAGLIAVPLGQSYGLEFTAVGGSYDNRNLGGGGFNLFWRDPSLGRAGLTTDYVRMDTQIGAVDAYRVGGEVERYLGRYTLRGQAGAVTHSALQTIIEGHTYTAANAATKFYSTAALDYYLRDNLKVSVGHSYASDKHAATVGAEWGFAVGDGKSMAALFTDASFASGETTVMGGLRFYTGQKTKTLIQRQREDDATLVDALVAISAVAVVVNLALPAFKSSRENAAAHRGKPNFCQIVGWC